MVVSVAGGVLPAPYSTGALASSRKKRKRETVVHENVPGLHGFVRAALLALRGGREAEESRARDTDSERCGVVEDGSELGAAVSAAVAAERRRDGSDGAVVAVSGADYALSAVADRVLDNPGEDAAAVTFEGRWRGRLPPRAATLLADASRWARPLLRRGAGPYDVVVADPPWPSRSATTTS